MKAPHYAFSPSSCYFTTAVIMNGRMFCTVTLCSSQGLSLQSSWSKSRSFKQNSALKMEAVLSSEKLNLYKTTWHYSSQDSTLLCVLLEWEIKFHTHITQRMHFCVCVGEFSVLQVNFNLQRHTGYFLIQVYVPCILIVVLSWVSFWIHREATSDRVGLGKCTHWTVPGHTGLWMWLEWEEKEFGVDCQDKQERNMGIILR